MNRKWKHPEQLAPNESLTKEEVLHLALSGRDNAYNLLYDLVHEMGNGFANALQEARRVVGAMEVKDDTGVPEDLGRTRHTRDDHGRKIDEILAFLRSKYP